MRHLLLILSLLTVPASAAEPLRLGIVGLEHGHVTGFLRQGLKRSDVKIVGVAEPNAEVSARYIKQFQLDPAIVFRSLEEMLEKTRPNAVATMTSTFDHKRVVEVCAARGVHVMMEKPLAVSVEHGRAIAEAARKNKIHVLVNYETTWYANNSILWSEIKEKKSLGEIRKAVIRDGHQGPKEINVQPEFFAWLTDPVQNGAGALYDFGCYGANIMTWLMDNQRPLTVTAVTQQIKPAIYQRVDDDATIIVTYPRAQAVIQASWNWPYSRKDLDIYGQTGYIQTIAGKAARVKIGAAEEETRAAPPAAAPYDEPLSYLSAVVRGEIQPSGLSALENNLIVTEILDAARRSSQTGRTVKLNQ
jgi:predicted dehydrogenase